MALRLRGATSGYIELKAPASAGDNTLTLPTNNGSANQLLKTDGSGNLSWVDDNSGVSLSGSTNNTIATVTGANALIGEANLTFDGSSFSLTSGTGNQFPLTIRNDFTPNTERSDLGYFGNLTSNNALRIGTVASNGGVTFQSTKLNDSSVKLDLILNPDGGNLGIGTTSPDYNLDIRATSGDTWVSVRGGTNQGYQVRKADNTLIGYYGSGGGVNLGVNDNAISAPAGNLRFQTGGTAAANERFLIDSAGNIECKRGGIDAVPPFQIYGSGNASDAVADNLRIHNWGDANGDYWQLGSNLGMDASGNNSKPSTTLKGAAVNIDGRGGRIFLKTSPGNTSTVNEGFVMNELGHITKPKQPRFCAIKNGSGSTPTTTNATQIFQDEQIDIGGHYDHTTGIFTAPVTGAYFFSCQMLTNSTDTRTILKMDYNNGTQVMELSATADNYNSIQGSILYQMSANDTMRIKNASNSNNTGLYADSSDQNQFMGWLVC